jgi:hypothetical protein
MAGAATEIVGEGKGPQAGSSSRESPKPRARQENGEEGRRFFLAKPGTNHPVPEFSKEVATEAEAIVESLKTGLNYYVVSEWRGVARFSGRKPQLRREAVQSLSKAG